MLRTFIIILILAITAHLMVLWASVFGAVLAFDHVLMLMMLGFLVGAKVNDWRDEE